MKDDPELIDLPATAPSYEVLREATPEEQQKDLMGL